jgi:hypothetical protein
MILTCKSYEVLLYDAHGHFIKGELYDEDHIKVTQSNIIFRGAILFKQPFLSWELAMTREGDSTYLKPKELLKMSRMFEEGWSDEGEDADIDNEDVIEGDDDSSDVDPDSDEEPDDEKEETGERDRSEGKKGLVA